MEQMVRVQQELYDRQSADPLFTYEPTPKQRPFIDSVLGEKYFENWFCCANRAGKSDAGSYCGAALARFGQDPKGYSRAKGSDIEVNDRATSGWVSSVTYQESLNILQPKYFDNGYHPPGARPPFIPEREIADWRMNEKLLKLKSGSIIGFKSSESGVSGYQGVEKDWIHFDEEHPYNVYKEASIRVGAGKRLKIFGTATLLPPLGKIGGVTWVYSEILKPWLDGKKTNVGCFTASIYDNPYILQEELRSLEAKFAPESPEGRIRLGGEWLPGISGARAYPQFNAALHVIEQGPPKPNRPLVWCWDFNVVPLITSVGQRDGRFFRFFKTFHMDSGNVPEMCEWFIEFYPRHFGEVWVYGDSTGKNRTSQTGISDYRTIQNHMRRYPSPVRLKVPESNPAVPDRISAVNRALKNEDGESMIEIDPECEDLILDFEQVQRDPRGGIKKTSDPSDPYFQRTHASDGVGYWISFEEPVKRIVDMNEYRSIKIKTPAYGFSR